MVTGARGTRVTPETTLEAVRGGTFNALVLPGGTKGAENLAASPLVREMVLKFHKAGKIVAAICAAPAIVLAPLGVLDGRSATCFPGMENRFPKSVAFKTDPVVVDGNWITSRALGTALAFSLALAEKLTDRATAERVRRAVLG
jgi:4-methyl-5(b-hydroxyethyl)-thiazole monophosphate biosynthesis